MTKHGFCVHGFVALLSITVADRAHAETQHGQASDAGDSFVAYEAHTSRWLTPDEFWRAHIEQQRGHHWGQGERYPPYADVDEHDTFLVVVDGRTCLMEFFHRRWRRANDVWRWNDRFNTYGACAVVFD
jgi:hypothetical protein